MVTLGEEKRHGPILAMKAKSFGASGISIAQSSSVCLLCASWDFPTFGFHMFRTVVGSLPLNS